MEDISQLIQAIIVVVICLGFVVFILLCIFYKGVQKQITVVNKRKTLYGGMNNMRTRQITETRLTVDCKVNGKIRTYLARTDIYDRLKVGKSYKVKVNFGEIILVYNK